MAKRKLSLLINAGPFNAGPNSATLKIWLNAIPPPIVKEKKHPNDILSLLFSLFSLFFLYHTYQSITITLFSVIVKSTVIVKSASACSFSSFSSSSSAHVGFSSGEFSEKFSLAHVSTSNFSSFFQLVSSLIFLFSKKKLCFHGCTALRLVRLTDLPELVIILAWCLQLFH